MKLIRIFAVLAALVPFSAAAQANLAAVITNVVPSAMRAVPRPCIIFIQCHGLASGDLGCYGQTNFQTPNLDRLAAVGVRFTRYVGGADSPATTALLLAGGGAAPDGANLAQRLQAVGYHTGLIGEWGLPGQPWTGGFDEFAGFLDDAEGQNYYADYLWRYAPGAILDMTNNQASDFSGKEMIYANTGGKQGKYLPDLLVSAMLAFARANEPDAANHFRPFFLLVNLSAPRTARAGADVFPVPTDAPFSSEPWPQAARDRAALITRLDGGIGQLSEQLGKLKLTNAVVFFASSSAPEKFANTNMDFLLPPGSFRDTNNAARVDLPLIVSWPGNIPAGHVHARSMPLGAADVMHTILEIGRAKPASGSNGVSALPILLDDPGTNGPILQEWLDLKKRLGV